MNEAGGEYRRALAALFVAHSLNGTPLSVIPGGETMTIESVSLESDNPVDDIVVGLVSGELLLQAKRTLTFRRPFNEVALQWIRAVRQPGFDPDHHLLGVGSGHVSAPLKVAANAIHRRRVDAEATWTEKERTSVEKVRSILGKHGATAIEIDLVLSSAVFIERRVEEQHEEDAEVGRLLLDGHVVETGYGARAWRELISAVGHAARNRLGRSIEGWADELRHRGLPLVADVSGSRAARIENRRRAVLRYRERLFRTGNQVDLTGLGARLHPISLEEMDADLTVRDPSSDERFGHRLLWALRRRGRVILTGLPGGGKSTSLKTTAGHWAQREHWTTPIVVSLRRLADDDHFRRRALRENILDLAVENEPPDDREVVRDALDHALGEGEVALFLDGLDEAADRRLLLAADLNEMLTTVHPDTDVLVATRDAAYSDAAILGFNDLVLNTPQDVKPTMRAVLSAIANQRGIAAEKSWVEERLEWVNGILRVDTQLRETPLIPVLLSLLAGERDVEELPTTRATILQEAIQYVVVRHEAHRTIGLQALPQGHEPAVLTGSFPLIAGVISRSDGTAPRHRIVEALDPYLQSQWGLPPGPARTTAAELVRFWDEAGIFVAEGSRKLTSPRVQLFLEIGAALEAASKPASGASEIVDEWADEPDRRESLVLAAGLSRAVAEALIDWGDARGNDELTAAAADAIAQGGEASEDHLRRLSIALIRAMSPGDADAWRRFQQLFRIPVPRDVQMAAVERLSVFETDHAMTGRAYATLRWGIEIGDRTSILESVLRTKALPQLPIRQQVDARTRILEYAGADQLLMSAKVEAAAELLPDRPDLAQDIADSIRHASISAADRLEHILIENGHAEIARQAIKSMWTAERATQLFEEADTFDDEITKTVAAIADLAPPGSLTKSQARRLDELAEFVETMNLNDMSGWPRGGALDEIRGVWYRLVAQLGAFDSSVLAAQAQLVSGELLWDEARKVGLHPDRDGYFSLFDGASPRKLEHWESVDDIEAGRDLAVHLLAGGPGLAVVAAQVLVTHPDREGTASVIEKRVPDVPRRSTRAAIWAIVHLVEFNGTVVSRLARHDRSAVRAAVASLCDPLEDDQLTDVARALLSDEKRDVQNAVLDRLDGAAGGFSPQVIQTLTKLSEFPPRPFTCISCGTENDATRASCSSCNVVNDRPDQKASKLLEQLNAQDTADKTN